MKKPWESLAKIFAVRDLSELLLSGALDAGRRIRNSLESCQRDRLVADFAVAVATVFEPR